MLNQMDYAVENSTGDNPRILVVEDDPATAELLQDYLQDTMNAELQVASSAQQALDLDEENPAEVVLIDYLLPDMDGVKLISSLNARRHRPAIMMTGHPTLGRAIEAMRLGATDLLVKPFDMDKLSQSILSAIGKHRQFQLRLKRLMRMRDLSKKVIRERKNLRRKMDVVCRDVVVAYRDLAEKVGKLPNKG
jgi:DNA-binding NtrC family response regulator